MSKDTKISISDNNKQDISMFLDNIHTYIYTLQDFNNTMLNIFSDMENLDTNTLLLLQNCKYIEKNINGVIRHKDYLYEHLSQLGIINED